MLRRSDHDVSDVPTNHKCPCGWWLHEIQGESTILNGSLSRHKHCRKVLLNSILKMKNLVMYLSKDVKIFYLFTCKDNGERHLPSWKLEQRNPFCTSLCEYGKYTNWIVILFKYICQYKRNETLDGTWDKVVNSQCVRMVLRYSAFYTGNIELRATAHVRRGLAFVIASVTMKCHFS